MPQVRAGLTVLLAYALLAATARGADPPPPAAGDPDPSFLEFLGGVDGLSEVNPNYLAQVGGPHPAPPAATKVVPPPPPPAPSASGANNNE